MKNEEFKRFNISVLICTLSCAITMAKIDPIPAGWTLVEDDNPGWAIHGGASYISTDEIPQLKQRLPQGNNTHIGIWEYIGAQAELAFEGTGVRIYGYQPGEGGKADIYIEDKLEASGVLWNPKAAFEPDHLFFEKTGLSQGVHTLSIKSIAPGFETLGQDNASVPNIDYVLVQGRGTPTPQIRMKRPRISRDEHATSKPGATFNEDEDIAFPSCAAVVDVTKSPYNAKGDGKTDDTDAIQKALRDTMGQHRIVYLPNGTYLVSRTIKWAKQDSHGEDAWGFNHIQGQNAAKTVIRLKDRTFKDPDDPKSIMWCGGFGSADWFHNYIQNVTFDIGNDNPGAIGLQFYSNNTGAVRNLRIISEDGQGVIGLDLASDMNGPLLARNVLVRGFAIGIRCGHSVNSQTLEHISLLEQSQCALYNDGQSISVRSLYTQGPAKAVQTDRGLMALLNANIVGKGPAANLPAITANGRFYARDITTSGYREAIVRQGDNSVAAGPNIVEFMSHPPSSPFSSPVESLRLPVEDTPDVPWDDPKTWAVVEAPNGDGDAAPAIQKAIDSGATTILIALRENAQVHSPVMIRGKARRIVGIGAAPGHRNEFENSFIIGEGDWPVVVFEHFDNLHGVKVEVNTDRTIVFRSTIARLDLKRVGKLFLEDFGSSNLRINPGQYVWARQLNIENQGTHLTNNGGALWVLGYKTERGGTLLDVRGGGWAELFGNFSYTTTAGSLAPMFVNTDSAVFAFFNEVCFNNDPFRTLIRETRSGTTKEVAAGQGDIAPYIGYAKE